MKAILALVLSLMASVAAAADATSAAARAQARDILGTVVAFKTSQGLGQVPVMANWLAQEFRKGGFAAEDIHVLPLGESASLVVRYRGDGSSGKKPIALMAHMDVVTARREEWQRDPYTMIEENGYFFGRGTADNKQGVVTLASNFLRLKAEGFVPNRDLIIVFSGDEETDQATIQSLAADHRDLIDAEYALNFDGGGGELDDTTGAPLYMVVTGAEKAYADFTLTTRSPGGHSSRPRADNAIYTLVDVLKALQAWRFPVSSNEWTLGNLKATAASTPGELGQAMARFAANPKDDDAADVLFDSPAHVGQTRTTCVATRLDAGHANNALPQTATATVNCRIFPGTGVDEVQATLQRVAGNNVDVQVIGQPLVAGASPMRADVMAAVLKAAHVDHPGVPVVPTMTSGATDAVVLRRIGIPTYGVGGLFMKDKDDFVHGLNERIPVDSFYDSLAYAYLLIKDLSTTH